MPRAYLPLKTVVAAYPHPLRFANGARLVSRAEFPASNLKDWHDIFSLRELREIDQWNLALACDWDSARGTQGKTPEQCLADARLALQVAAPVGTFLSVSIREQDDSENPALITTRFAQFHGTVWSRIRGFTGMTASEVETLANGVTQILEGEDLRPKNLIRLFEHGLVSSDPYIRILLWVTAMDGILMAVKEEIFVRRLYAMVGSDSLVFPQGDGVYIARSTTVGDIAKDLFELRSELAHGRPIGPRFWEAREDLRNFFPPSVYAGTPRYRMLLEEGALSLLTRILRKIILEDLVNDFLSAKKCRAKLDS